MKKKTHSEFLRELQLKNKHYELDFLIASKYNSHVKPILVETKYGICKTSPSSLLQGGLPTISKAINKNEYFKNLSIDKNCFDYDYSKVEYINMKTPIILICKKHGEFKITPSNHLHHEKGCMKCGHESTSQYQKNNHGGYRLKDWIKKAENSKNFNSYKLYVIKCFNDNELFYKIGITFKSVEQRFRSINLMPYKYELIKEISNKDPKYIYDLESKLHRENRNNKYKPLINFNGMHECFKLVNTLKFVK